MDRHDAFQYLSNFDLDYGRLGERISAGKQHQIYQYGDDQVVKIPRRSLFMKVYGPFHYETVVRDLNILNDFLGEFVVPTQVLRSKSDDSDYVILQQHLKEAQFLTGINFPDVREDFIRVVQSNAQIILQHRVSLDFFGNIGFQRSLLASSLRRKDRALMNNLLVVRENSRLRIKIADTNLSELRLHFHHEVGLFQWLVDSMVFKITKFLIHDNFDVTL